MTPPAFQLVSDPECDGQAPLARFEGVGVRYGAQWALRGIDLTLPVGDRLALIGPNGAGKSTLLKLLMGLVPLSEGRLYLAQPPPRIGYVPQRLTFDLSFPVSVEEFLAVASPGPARWFGGVPRKKKQSILATLEKVDAAHVARQKLGTLSGGQLQRVLIAAALLQNPQLLILDEPSASIDQRGADELQSLLLSLHEECGLTLLFVSHDLHWVGQLANRVACLNGTLCGVGSPDEVLSDHHLHAAYGGTFSPQKSPFARARSAL